METLFSLVNASVLPAWALLVLAPVWRGTRVLVHSMLYPIILGAVYTIGLGLALFGGMGSEGTDFTTVKGVRAIFSSDLGIVIGWTHYLVFDLFVGARVARDSQTRGVRHWLTIPCLLLTFMAGPLGLLLYLIIRTATRKGGWDLSPNQRIG